jgi:hypothetical protein
MDNKNTHFVDNTDMANYLLFGNRAIHNEADVIIKLDSDNNLIFIGEIDASMIVDAGDYKQWMKLNA